MAARRIRKGGGETLPPFRWWQLFTRTLYLLMLPGAGGASARYAVDVRQLGDRSDGVVRARLYVNERLELLSRMPASFPVPGGHIEVAAGTFGMRRCHYVPAGGTPEQLHPHPKTAEGRRARLHRTHPLVSRAVGATATVLVLLGVIVAIPQLLETLLAIPPVRESLGTFELPVDVPPAVNVAVGVAAVAGSAERALRLRSNWLDNLAS
ncbi:hypothetical protein [Arthrobacter gandavensis]|uniref:hypothetical protein n=1 Tax=Arthrobacter gandavensis TaxID=169960 RepID=UPI001E5EE225|nr:hypothetical protein [Arthrobacter gandavensis]